VHQTGSPGGDASALGYAIGADGTVAFSTEKAQWHPSHGILLSRRRRRGRGDLRPVRSALRPLAERLLKPPSPSRVSRSWSVNTSQQHTCRSQRMGSMTETVKAFAVYGPQFFPDATPVGGASSGIGRKHAWFERSVIVGATESSTEGCARVTLHRDECHNLLSAVRSSIVQLAPHDPSRRSLGVHHLVGIENMKRHSRNSKQNLRRRI